jgi:hypothetical protein
MTDKRLVSVALEEGFLNDRVRVRVGDREVADLAGVSTRVQIGLARTLEVELGAGEQMLTVDLPDKQLTASVSLAAAAYVGVSVGNGGDTLAIRSGEAPPGYA